MNILNTTELYTIKWARWEILYKVCFTKRKKKKENREEWKREHQNFAKQQSAQREIYKGKYEYFLEKRRVPIQ